MKNDPKNTQAPWWQPGLVLFGRLSGWIGGPVILGVILGKWLDRKYGTEPWLFLLTVGLAFAVSMFGIIRDSLREIRRIEKEEKIKKQN
ncbi:MAG: AtpZ/AtpI family protein [Patescibacteria group bacterium]